MKISLIIPVYNEEKLLPAHLEFAAPFVDEIIIVDGSPEGPSTDGTQDICAKRSKYDNIKIVKGKFELPDRPGGWDKGAQMTAGVKKSFGDVIVLTSCDCVYGDYEQLVNEIRNFPDGKVYYCHVREFFIDTKHLRLTPTAGFPQPFIGYVAMKKDIFIAEQPAYFDVEKVKNDFIFMPDIAKYHYGWITDFDTQVRKHCRSVKRGLWGEYGESILSGGEKGLETWAITHIINYAKEVTFPYAGKPGPFDEMKFSYLNSFDEVMKKFREKYGEDYYDCV